MLQHIHTLNDIADAGHHWFTPYFIQTFSLPDDIPLSVLSLY
jgi:hypothetical protein